MEELLCDAAMRGDLQSLHEIIAQDNYILDKVLVGSFKGKNPLHLATSTGQEEFVLKLLEIKPKLAEVIDTELGAALHIASANGDVKIVEALVELSPEMCMARDRDGKNPLHIAAMKGKVDVLKKLVETCPRAVQVISDRGDTILHLCVNYNQLESLLLLLEMIRDPDFVESKDANGNTILHIAVFGKHFEMIRDPDFVESKDANGNTILHIAVFGKRFEIVKHVLIRTEIYVNAINGAGWTAMDLYFFIQNRSYRKEVDIRIEKVLRATGAKRREQMAVITLSPRAKELMQTLMVISSLFATMAFQVGVNPPGNVWQDDSEEHLAGKAILAYKYPKSYLWFMYFNTVGFLLALSLILFLLMFYVQLPKHRAGWVMFVMPLLTIMTTAFAYTYSIIVVSPKHMAAVTITILVSATLWALVMSLFAVGVAATHERARPKKDRQTMFTIDQA